MSDHLTAAGHDVTHLGLIPELAQAAPVHGWVYTPAPAAFGRASNQPDEVYLQAASALASRNDITAWRPATHPVRMRPDGLPESVRIFPTFAHAALKAREQDGVVVWASLRAVDPTGSGRVPGPRARQVVGELLKVRSRQVRRVLAAGDNKFWRTARNGDICYASALRVAMLLGVEHVSRAHLVPIDEVIGGGARIKAALLATTYRGDDKTAPLTRRRVGEMTGLSRSTQKRYENRYGYAEVVAPVFVRHPDQEPWIRKVAVVHERHDWGFFIGKSGDLVRRHGDRRRSHHTMLSGASSRRLNRQLAGGGVPVLKTRGRTNPRVYFERDAGSWLRSREALGKVQGRKAFDHTLHYSVLARIGRNGRLSYVGLREPRRPSGPDILWTGVINV